MMNDIFHDLIMEGVVMVYLDDILTFMKMLEEHREVTHQVPALLKKHKLFLKPDKCEFEKTRVEYLGVIVSHNSVDMANSDQQKGSSIFPRLHQLLLSVHL